MNDAAGLGELFQKLVDRRRSTRDFKPDPVPREVIEAVLCNAQRAPSN